MRPLGPHVAYKCWVRTKSLRTLVFTHTVNVLEVRKCGPSRTLLSRRENVRAVRKVLSGSITWHILTEKRRNSPLQNGDAINCLIRHHLITFVKLEGVKRRQNYSGNACHPLHMVNIAMDGAREGLAGASAPPRKTKAPR